MGHKKKRQTSGSIPDYRVSVKGYSDSVTIKFTDLNPTYYRTINQKQGTRATGVYTKAQQKGLMQALSLIEPEAEGWIILTWPSEYPTNFDECQKQVKLLLKEMRRKGHTRYVLGWEFQKRGAPHVNIVVPEYIPHLFLKDHWYEIVGSKDPNHYHRGVQIIDIRSTKGQRFKWYIAGYIGKRAQKEAPEGFRNMRRWGSWSKHYSKPSMNVELLLTESQVMEFYTPVINARNAELQKLNEVKGTTYHIRDMNEKLKGVHYIGGLNVVTNALLDADLVTIRDVS